ncbi:unnamed protein product [Durusdinium trenchii]|uniref:Apple domain-containing protein n=1 Tax=Durusdinium trenchii TaxID=1381693 RepID=A0ABP0SAE4_9DINO
MVVLATNAAATGRRDIAQEFVWVTDVFPPKDLSYPNASLYVVKDVPMAPMIPVVTTRDCRSLPSVANTVPQLVARDCAVQNYDIQPDLPAGLTLDPISGVISGTATELQARPEIYLVTATNEGGKTSAYITLAVIGQIRDSTLSSCVTAPMTGDLVLTFRLPSISEVPRLEASRNFPQMLRLVLLRPLLLTLLRSSGDPLGDVSRRAAMGCGTLVLDVDSTAPGGFPPPTLCHWQDSKDLNLGDAGAIGARLHLLFQGEATFQNDFSYQMVLKAGFTPSSANQELLELTLFASEASQDERGLSADAFGAWTNLAALPKSSPALQLRQAVLLPQEDTPWYTGRPIYSPGFSNPLVGEVPSGYPYPEGFPAPGVRTCVNFSSYCATSPHQYVNTAEGTAWYQDTDAELGLFPFFALLTGTAVLLQEIQAQMLFNPFGSYALSAVNSFSLTERVLTNLMSFQMEFALSPDISGALTLEQFITACPSSPLRTPLMRLGPVCSVLAGPSFVTCTCESSLQNHPLQRCDRLRIRVNAGGDIRASITASVRLFATEDWWPGYQPTQWYIQLKSEFGGLNSYRKVANAGFTVWQDFLMVQTTPELCAAECLSRLNNPAPCNSFKYHKVDQDCYLSSYVESAASPLRTDWPGDVFDYYEYQEQVAYALQTQQVLVFSGVFFSNITMLAETYLQPPPPSAPAFGAVELFFPSYVNQPWLRCRIDLSLVVPIHGQSTPTSLDFLVPSGFLGMALETRHVAVPTPLGRGYCGVGRCRWLLTDGQALWPKVNYGFQVTFRNPPDPRLVGESWILQVVSSGFVDGPSYSSAPVSVPHPLAVDGQLLGCAVHLNDPKYQPSLGNTNSSLDLFFVLANAWSAGAVLVVQLPEAFSLTSDCEVWPLTPWLRWDEVACTSSNASLAVNFTAPLPSGAALALRIAPLFLTDFAPKESLNLRLESRPVAVQQQFGGALLDARDACHPKVWSCGLYPVWAAELVWRPSLYRLDFFEARLSNLERRRSTWVHLRFAVNTTLAFQGNPEDILKISPPYGFSILDVHSSSLQALRRREQSGQLNLPEVVDLPTAIETSKGTFLLKLDSRSNLQGLRVSNLYGVVQAQQQHFVNLSVSFPESGVEPSLVDVLSREPNRSACANVWGLGFEAEDQALVSGFAQGEILAALEQLVVECNTRAVDASNALSIRFRATGRVLSLPAGESLVIALRFSQDFEMTEPSPVAEYAAPDMRSTETGVELEGRTFRKLGCPSSLALYSLGRRLRQELPGCVVFFNDFQSITEVFFNASGVVPDTSNEVLLRVRNPPWTGSAPNITLVAYRTDRRPFRLVPVPLSLAESTRALVPLQVPLTTRCDPLLRAMEAEVFAGSCLLPGFASEVTLGFLAPEVFQAPVAATLRAPEGFRIAWDCNFEASQLVGPGGRTLEFLLAGFFSDCVVMPDGRSISFTITRDIKAVTSWTFFTIHAVNPPVEELPASTDQSSWALEVGAHAAYGAMQLPLRTFQAELVELPHWYNATTRPVLLSFSSFSPVPAGGYVVLTAPEGLLLPEQCAPRRQAATAGLPVLPTQPFRALGNTPQLTTSCEVDGQHLRIALLEGSLPAGHFELRFIITEGVNFAGGARQWRLESYTPQSCQGTCCVRRPHFRNIVGLDSLQLLDTAVFYAPLPGRFRHLLS